MIPPRLTRFGIRDQFSPPAGPSRGSFYLLECVGAYVYCNFRYAGLHLALRTMVRCKIGRLKVVDDHYRYHCRATAGGESTSSSGVESQYEPLHNERTGVLPGQNNVPPRVDSTQSSSFNPDTTTRHYTEVAAMMQEGCHH